jgi:hypothetical protein
VEKRRFTRIPFNATAHVVSANGSWYSKLIDVSLKGALITCPQDWEAELGEHFLLEVILDNSDVVISMEASVAHIDEEKVGFDCINIGLDSISHLRRLIDFNLGSEELLERELHSLIEPDQT